MTNIVHMIWHDLGDYLSCYGRPEIPSPSLQTLSEEGVVFERNFCTAPQCTPSRASIMTGRYPHSNGLMGLTHRGWSYNTGERDMPMILNGAGYDTCLVGFQHERSWDEAHQLTYAEHVTGLHGPEEIAAAARTWLADEKRESRRFYLNVGFTHVHRNFGTEYDPEVLAKVEVPSFLPDVPMVRKDIATFYENIRRADAAVGEVLKTLDDAGLAEDTIVIFTTDHGPAFPRAKMSVYDPGLKTALLMRRPGHIKPGSRVDEMISNVDLLPSLLEAIDVDIPENVQGRSFWPLLIGKPYEPRTEVFGEITWHGGQYDPIRCIRTECYKYVHNFIPGHPILIQGPCAQRYGTDFINEHYSAWRPEHELYDLANDPGEFTNIAEKPESAAVLAELREKLQKFLEETEDPLLAGDVPQPEESDYACYWQMRKGAVFQLNCDRDFGEYPFEE